MSELKRIIKNLKNGKTQGFDRISNEMIKSTPQCLLDIILKYINLCLDKSMISKSLCYDIIYPIFKEGSTSDPGNYRGICMSSAILKLITSLICERLQAKSTQLNILKNNQIVLKKLENLGSFANAKSYCKEICNNWKKENIRVFRRF